MYILQYQLGTAVNLTGKETIDPSLILSEKDKQKPTEESLKAPCGTGKKKRACANCTCGLGKYQIIWIE